MRHSRKGRILKNRVGKKSVKAVSEEGGFQKSFYRKSPKSKSSTVGKSATEIIGKYKSDFFKKHYAEQRYEDNSHKKKYAKKLLVFSVKAGYNHT